MIRSYLFPLEEFNRLTESAILDTEINEGKEKKEVGGVQGGQQQQEEKPMSRSERYQETMAELEQVAEALLAKNKDARLQAIVADARELTESLFVSGKEFIDRTAGESTRCLSAISISEIAIKHGIGKLDFTWQQVLEGVSDLEIEILPYTDAHAKRLFGLPLHHKDPFDRQIIAQALAEAIPVVTPDRFFKLYEGVEVVW